MPTLPTASPTIIEQQQEGCTSLGCACEYGSSACLNGLVCLDLEATGENKCVEDPGARPSKELAGSSDGDSTLLFVGAGLAAVAGGAAVVTLVTRRRRSDRSQDDASGGGTSSELTMRKTTTRGAMQETRAV